MPRFWWRERGDRSNYFAEYAATAARFAAHSGMRVPSELLNMKWGRVDLAGRTYTTDPRDTKGKRGGRERQVPLGDVAVGILERLRPADPGPEDQVWINTRGGPQRDISSAIERRKAEVVPRTASCG